jgi:hypothetical protein
MPPAAPPPRTAEASSGRRQGLANARDPPPSRCLRRLHRWRRPGGLGAHKRAIEFLRLRHRFHAEISLQHAAAQLILGYSQGAIPRECMGAHQKTMHILAQWLFPIEAAPPFEHKVPIGPRRIGEREMIEAI